MTDEEFIRVNPHKKVPAINDNGFTLSERSGNTICSLYVNPSMNDPISHAALQLCST